jgi:hypothetical protein
LKLGVSRQQFELLCTPLLRFFPPLIFLGFFDFLFNRGLWAFYGLLDCNAVRDEAGVVARIGPKSLVNRRRCDDLLARSFRHAAQIVGD